MTFSLCHTWVCSCNCARPSRVHLSGNKSAHKSPQVFGRQLSICDYLRLGLTRTSEHLRSLGSRWNFRNANQRKFSPFGVPTLVNATYVVYFKCWIAARTVALEWHFWLTDNLNLRHKLTVNLQFSLSTEREFVRNFNLRFLLASRLSLQLVRYKTESRLFIETSPSQNKSKLLEKNTGKCNDGFGGRALHCFRLRQNNLHLWVSLVSLVYKRALAN